MALKTPGVYIVENNAFPSAVVEVATAVPAFIGYTCTAVDRGTSLIRKPWRIASMAEYQRCFGGAPEPVFRIQAVAPGRAAALPDMVDARGQQAAFRVSSQDCLLTRAAGKAGGRFLMHQAMRHFFLNGGGPCYIVSVGSYRDEIAAGDEHQGLIGGLTPLLQEREPTLLVVPDAVLLTRADCARVQAAVLKHCGRDTRDRFAILDVWGGERERHDERGDCIETFRQDLGVDAQGFAAAYYPWLHTSLVQLAEVDCGVIDNRVDLAQLIGTELRLDEAAAGDTRAAALKALLGDLGNDAAAWKARLVATIASSSKTDDDKAKATAALDDPEALGKAIAAQRGLLHQSLLAASKLYSKVLDEALALLNLMPPAAAVAGLYTTVDSTRGVWQAPANVSLAGVLQPAVAISDAEQQDLNVPASGKSINTIRNFVGKGPLVWGARTLDGNSPEWRYVNVRRTLIMIEQSCLLAAQALVFEPNAASTWVTLKSMLGNFLTGIWKRGGLAGAVPDDAFGVRVGLGETMTAQDIVEGRLRVTVLVAVTRPAEFTVISLQLQMQMQTP